MSIVEFDRLKKYYGKQMGVEDVTFSIEEGEVFGFIGPNGAGKSTAIRCALSLIFPTEGAITIFGKDSVNDRSEIAEDIGYLPSEVRYYERMRVKSFLDYAGSFYEDFDPAYQTELVELLALDTSKRIGDLSLGNRKKVGVIQAFQHKPRLLMLDEPTSGLDPLMQQKFFDLVERHRHEGATVLFSSHVLSEVKRLSDRIAIIREGVVRDINTVAELEQATHKLIHLVAAEEQLTVLDKQPGFEVKTSKPGERHYTYDGDLQQLFRLLADIPTTNATVEDPSLEELFLRYYED